MPYAIVIRAFPTTDLPVVHVQGKVLHGLFHELLQKASATKGDEIHDTAGLKPFSTALLLNDRQRRAESIRTGEELKVRFTFLDDEIYPLLSRYFLTTPNLRLELVRTELTVARILTTPHSGETWAGCTISTNRLLMKKNTSPSTLRPRPFSNMGEGLPTPI